jgi:mono/diheme cytochrome c family protein
LRRSPEAIAVVLWATIACAGEPAVDYALNCQGCHRADGAATPGSVPALAGSVGRFLHVRGGREYLGQVPGAALSSLDDAALAGVLNWILERFGGEAEFTRYTAEEVGRLRKSPLVDVEKVRARVLAGAG